MRMRLMSFWVLASLGLVSCSQSPTMNSSSGSYPAAKVGVSISSIATNPFFQSMNHVFDAEAKAHAGDNLKVFLESADNSQDTQNAQLTQMTAQGAQALVVNLADVAQGKAVLDDWCSKNVPVVYFNRSPGARNLANCANAYFVDGDVTQAAVYQGLQVLQQWQNHPEWDKNGDGVIQYAILKGLPGHEGSEKRTKWAISTLETYPKLHRKTEKVFEDFALFQSAKADEIVSQWQANPDFAKVEVILANNDTMALGALAALEKQNIALPIFGIDGSKAALQAVQQGKLAGTVFNDFEGQAKASLRLAANLAAGKDLMDGVVGRLEHKTVIIDSQDITPDNLQQFMTRYYPQ